MEVLCFGYKSHIEAEHFFHFSAMSKLRIKECYCGTIQTGKLQQPDIQRPDFQEIFEVTKGCWKNSVLTEFCLGFLAASIPHNRREICQGILDQVSTLILGFEICFATHGGKNRETLKL